ncbi:Ldh family oxidoreductase [Cohnella hongkongensis]|uniref:Ldh family oxidoreductase n=1 Tax=Cohnella hongkongensis TaxID=178337 RepID=A0ABV9FIM6_9BACL
MKADMKYDWRELRRFCSAVLEAAGVRSQWAAAVADTLVDADLHGVDSHGVVRLDIYMRRLEAGMVDADAAPELLRGQTPLLLVDGNNNFGAVAGGFALEQSMKAAREYGCGIAGVRRSNHFGTCAYYARKAVGEGLIAIVLSNASQTMPPTGGLRPFLGTNPLCVGVPAGRHAPYILDMATSVVARGKIIVAAERGEPIPTGWAIDREGRPTTDAQAALAGSVLPLGGPKGYAIAMFIDILCGVLTGAGFGPSVHNMYEDWVRPQNVGHLFIAIDAERFMPRAEFAARMDQYIDWLKAEPTAPGVDEILVPGELERRICEQRSRQGLILPASVADTLRRWGDRYGIDLAHAETG